MAYYKTMKLIFLIAIALLTSDVGLAKNNIPELTRFEVPVDGQAAYKRGDYETALKQFKSLAYKGSVHAQAWLGIMYFEGKGVSKDLVMAYVWLKVSATNGGEVAHISLNNIKDALDKFQLKQAKKLSKLCLKEPLRCPEYSQ